MSRYENLSEKSFEKVSIRDITNSSILDDNNGDEPNSKTGNTEFETLSKKEPEVKWSLESEKIPGEWCDIAKCYKWLHNRAHQKYSILHACFTIPAIIFSTISGTASFATNSFPKSMQQYAPMVIGSVNIIIGILTTIQQYMKISELNEAHRVSGIAWDKFARNISIELAKAPEERYLDAGHFLKVYREEFDRLMETSPSIPKSVTQEFVQIFSGKHPYCCWPEKDDIKDEEENEEERKKRFKMLKKPDECDTIIVSELGKHDWYNLDRLPAKQPINPPITELSIENMLSKKINGIYERMQILEDSNKKKQLFNQATTNETNRIKTQTQQIEEAITMFYENYGRKPLPDELEQLLSGQINNDIITMYLKKYNYEDAIDGNHNV